MSDAPAAESLAIEAHFVENVEPTPRRCGRGIATEDGVPQEPYAVEFALAHERLRIDHQPRLTLSPEDVAAVEILVGEEGRGSVCAVEHLHGQVEQRALERPPAQFVAARNFFGPSFRLVREECERVRLFRLKPQPRK
jgi:hypothetical protein